MSIELSMDKGKKQSKTSLPAYPKSRATHSSVSESRTGSNKHTAATELQDLNAAITELYLAIKIRTTEEVSSTLYYVRGQYVFSKLRT